MYTVTGFGSMIADRIRTDAYCEALRRTVKPGSIVLDIGTGTGIFAMLACRFGAKKVYAVEPGDAIQVAREIAAANHCQDRIEFIQDLSTRVALAERADVVVSDIRGVLPLFGGHLPSIVDARERLLAPRGVLIPQRDSLWASVVEAPILYRDHTGPWADNPYGFDMTAAQPIVNNGWRKGSVEPEQLLTEPKCWATLDYYSISHPNALGEISWTVARAGTGHGLSVWFDATLAEGVGYSNSPLSPELIYGKAFFPWSSPVDLAADDVVSATLHANLLGDDYVWRWSTCVMDSCGRVKAQFKQSTFFGEPLSCDRLRKRATHHVPRLNEDAGVDQFALGLMDGRTSLDQVARSVADQFPDRFTTLQKAVARVGDLSQRYS
jgi:protein arginine N-methyltransferase 1